MVAHALWYKQIYSYMGMLEALSGAAVEVSFLSFDDILQSGIPDGIDVILNVGDAGTAFSGADHWLCPELLSKIREWVYYGGGFIGIGEPSAVLAGGHFFQLADLLGVDKELGFSLSSDKYFTKALDSHFITEDVCEPLNFGESMKNIYATKEETELIAYSNGEVNLSSCNYGEGRGVYLAGLPFSNQNNRLLLRAMYYAAHKESSLKIWFADNIAYEVHAYVDSGKYAIINNSSIPQTTTVYDGKGKTHVAHLDAGEIIWENIK